MMLEQFSLKKRNALFLIVTIGRKFPNGKKSDHDALKSKMHRCISNRLSKNPFLSLNGEGLCTLRNEHLLKRSE